MKRKYRELVELKGKMREKKVSYAIMAKELKISVSNFSDKINGKSVFNIVEVNIIAKVLGIEIEEIYIYFF